MDKLELKPCPFCGGEVRITVCDDEGNPHTDEYEDDAWSGLGYRLYHDIKCEGASDCPIAGHEGEGELGTFIYGTRKDAAEAWNERASGWIPCSERLPEDDVECLAFNRYGDMAVCYMHSDAGSRTGFIGNTGDAWHWDVTHWMPLPEPPEDPQ